MNEVFVTPVFEKHRDALRSRIASLKADQIDGELFKVVIKWIEDLLGTHSAFHRKLPDPERFLTNSVLSYSTRLARLYTECVPRATHHATKNQRMIRPWHNRVLQFVRDAVVALTAVLVISMAVSVDIGLSLLGVVLGVTLGQAFGSLREHVERNSGRSRYSKVSRPQEDSAVQEQADRVVDALSGTCQSFDDILKTYRVQLSNATCRQEHTIESQHQMLLQRIQTILGSAYSIDPQDIDDVHDLTDECIQLEKMLANEGLRVVKLARPTNAEEHYFRRVESSGLTAPKMVLPAILRGDIPILHGEVIVPRP